MNARTTVDYSTCHRTWSQRQPCLILIFSRRLRRVDQADQQPLDGESGESTAHSASFRCSSSLLGK